MTEKLIEHKQPNKYKLLFFLLITISVNAAACRFTVREIGFSILSQDIYTLAVIDSNADAGDTYWQQFRNKNHDCNLRLEVLNPETDREHPVVINAKKRGIKFPAVVLVAPDNRIYLFGHNNIQKIYSEILESDISIKMRSLFPDVFAVVLVVEGKNNTTNKTVIRRVKKDCDNIENLMPNMPKTVKNGPEIITISNENFKNETLILWSLGIENIPEKPAAFVIYGRGRIIGGALNYKQITEGGVYRYLSMIGADCECGLDRKWMLGHQIPLLWDTKIQQHLAKLLGFDVDNPMILSEMSQIITIETTGGSAGSVGFAPETIDLDKIFGDKLKNNRKENNELKTDNTIMVLTYTFLALLLIISIAGVIIIFRNRRK